MVEQSNSGVGSKIGEAREKLSKGASNVYRSMKDKLNTHTPTLATKVEHAETTVKKVGEEFHELGFW